MDERMRFVARLKEGEKMAVLCREFDISRKTGYKLFNRFKNSGIEGLTDRSRRPYRHANRLPFQIENLILQLKEKHSSWGAQKIRDKIKRKRPGNSQLDDLDDLHFLALVLSGEGFGKGYRVGDGLVRVTRG